MHGFLSAAAGDVALQPACLIGAMMYEQQQQQLQPVGVQDTYKELLVRVVAPWLAGTPLQSPTVFMKCGIYGTIQIIWGDGWGAGFWVMCRRIRFTDL